jgi:hypothetical protein
MPTILDENKVVLFNDPIKMYLFKETNEVKIAFKISDYAVINRQMSQEHFEYILENWNIADGVQGLEYGEGKIWWFHSKFGPRPECVPANFVNINFNRFTFRISVAEMERVVENYYHQKNNRMHWDES